MSADATHRESCHLYWCEKIWIQEGDLGGGWGLVRRLGWEL